MKAIPSAAAGLDMTGPPAAFFHVCRPSAAPTP